MGTTTDQGWPGWLGVPPDQLEWTPTDAGETALVWGDPATGPYGCFNRFPAGTVIPPHRHSHDNQLVVVEGVLRNYRLSDDAETRARAYPVGSFLYEVANTPHVTAVDPAGRCTVYVTQLGPLDAVLVDEPDPGA